MTDQSDGAFGSTGAGEGWQRIETAALNIAVMTKIDDDLGARNEQPLVMKQRTPVTRPMWWTPDGSMYVYYTPTHWKPLATGAAA